MILNKPIEFIGVHNSMYILSKTLSSYIFINICATIQANVYVKCGELKSLIDIPTSYLVFNQHSRNKVKQSQDGQSKYIVYLMTVATLNYGMSNVR